MTALEMMTMIETGAQPAEIKEHEEGWNNGDVLEYKGERYTVSRVRFSGKGASGYGMSYSIRTLTPIEDGQ
jgi:hypothetical protein